MNSILGQINLGDFQLGQVSSTGGPVTWEGLGAPRRVLSEVSAYSEVFISTLGGLRLGIVELGQVPLLPTIYTPFSGQAHPIRTLTPIGGYPRVFSSVLGTVQLGKFELGQIPAVSLTSPPGYYEVSGLATAIRQIRQGTLSIAFAGSALPIRTLSPNLGPLFAKGLANPIRTLAPIFYYSTMTFEGDAQPTSKLLPLVQTPFTGLGSPVRILAYKEGQSVNCLVAGPLTISGEIKNGSF
jgi:hypothetical protein